MVKPEDVLMPATLDELVISSDAYYALLDFISVTMSLGIISTKQLQTMNTRFERVFEKDYAICFDCDSLQNDCQCYYDEASTGFIYNDE